MSCHFKGFLTLCASNPHSQTCRSVHVIPCDTILEEKKGAMPLLSLACRWDRREVTRSVSSFFHLQPGAPSGKPS